MREGLLWFDPNPRHSIQARVDAAMLRFLERFGVSANCCHVPPSEMFSHPALAIVADGAIRPHHLLVGRDESLVVPARRTASPRSVRRARTPAGSGA